MDEIEVSSTKTVLASRELSCTKDVSGGEENAEVDVWEYQER